MAKRGQLTPEIQAVATARLGREISQAELRLMPYVQYCLINGACIDPSKINAEERAILSDWRYKGWITGGAAAPVETVLRFWHAMHKILWLGYVECDQ